MSFRLVLAMVAIAACSPAVAQEAVPQQAAPQQAAAPDTIASEVVRLSPTDREAALEAGARQAPINGAPGLTDGKIHGEMGFEVGSNGSRAIYGSTIIPLGQDGALGLSFFDGQSGRWRPR